jgi:hypothetical protein
VSLESSVGGWLAGGWVLKSHKYVSVEGQSIGKKRDPTVQAPPSTTKLAELSKLGKQPLRNFFLESQGPSPEPQASLWAPLWSLCGVSTKRSASSHWLSANSRWSLYEPSLTSRRALINAFMTSRWFFGELSMSKDMSTFHVNLKLLDTIKIY